VFFNFFLFVFFLAYYFYYFFLFSHVVPGCPVVGRDGP